MVALTEFWSDVKEASEGMPTLEVRKDSFPVCRGRCAIDCFDADISIAQGSYLVVLFSSETVSYRRMLDDVP